MEADERSWQNESCDGSDNLDDSIPLNEVDSDEPAVALLKQIFPDEHSEELRDLHQRRCRPDPILTDDFLRLPPNIAVRRLVNNRWRYELVRDLERRALRQHERIYKRGNNYEYLTRVVQRENGENGLGMTIVEEEGHIRVHWLAGLDTWQREGPSLRAGIRCGDTVIGIEGSAFVETVSPNESLIHHAVVRLRTAPNPVVVHIQRQKPTDPMTPLPKVISLPVSVNTPSLLDSSDFFSEGSSFVRHDVSFDGSNQTPVHANNIRVHPFIECLTNRGIINDPDVQLSESKMLNRLQSRARQWEDHSSFRIQSLDVIVPLIGVRKALSVRIVNMFEDGDETAYTIWVYDGESGKEWYAPVRYFRDFEDLRSATLSACKTVADIPFPKSRSSIPLFRSPKRKESGVQRETKCRQLELFLRTLCAMIYKADSPLVAEIAIHVQSFLGCDENDLDVPLLLFTSGTATDEEEAEIRQERIRTRLKRAIQQFTYRLFLLDSLAHAVNSFVDVIRTRGPTMQEIESLEAQGRDVLKKRAAKDMSEIQNYLDKVQELILESCSDDFEAIACRPEFDELHPFIQNHSSSNNHYWERLVREAVREQVEIEIYVPLRSVASRWLMYGWRHEDMEIQFKIKELRKRPQEFFRITKNGVRHNWSTVSEILSEGVGLSTLPCVKLRAIVAAACEIVRIHSLGKRQHAGDSEGNGEQAVLGADDFLPIFIYCVVNSEMERPCALCALLRTLCDRINKTGEIGYYLLTFEAAITHCQEVDLTEDREELQSFLSVPLNDT